MNYLAHGYPHLDVPYRVAGTAVPDWLSMVQRKFRLRARHLERATVEDEVERDLRDGARHHFRDDDRFHTTEAFIAAEDQITAAIRRAHPERTTLRARFLAHCTIEMLLDAFLIDRMPGVADRYYEALREVDAARVERFISRVLNTRVDLAAGVDRFVRERFLYDYCEDEGLERRLAQVIRRVGLPPLPPGFSGLVTRARTLVFERGEALLAAGREG